MAYDDPELPQQGGMRAVLRGDHLYVGDDKEPYVRDPNYILFLNVTGLTVSGGFDNINGEDEPLVKASPRLHGLIKLGGPEGHADFAVAGLEIEVDSKIKFELLRVGESETHWHWAALIDYDMLDEFIERGFRVTGHCPPVEFDAVLAAVRTGGVEHLRVALTTSMWTKQKWNGFAPRMPMVLHVAPAPDRKDSRPATEKGFIRSLTWTESYGGKSPVTDDAGKPAAKPTLVELAARAYELLKLIAGLLAALLILQFLRH